MSALLSGKLCVMFLHQEKGSCNPAIPISINFPLPIHHTEYMRILSVLMISVAFAGALYGQGKQPTPPAPPAAPASVTVAPPAESSPTASSATGIRFVLKTPMSLPSTIYMPLDSKRLEKVDIRPAHPGRRCLYPKSKIITLFGGLNEKGMPENKLVSLPLPVDLGPKTLALVGKNSNGEITMDFINEAELPMNCIYIQNLTGRTFTLEIPNPPTGEKSTIELPSKAIYIFGKNATPSPVSRPTPANLTYMTKLPNGKITKVKDRGMILTTYPSRKVVMIISPDPSGRTVVLSELMIFKEKPVAQAAK